MVQSALKIQAEAQTAEFLKIAASKWREMMRAGELGAEEIAKLRKARRPAPAPFREYGIQDVAAMENVTPRKAMELRKTPGEHGPLLDYAREVGGLEEGTQELAKRMGTTIEEIGMPQIRAGLRLAAKGEVRPLLKTLGQGAAAQAGGGYLTVPVLNRVMTTPGMSPVTRGLKKGPSVGADVLARRHEIDELRTAQKAMEQAAKKGTNPRLFIVGRDPETLGERMTAKVQDLQRKGAKELERRAPEVRDEKIRQAMQGYAAGSQQFIPNRPGTVMAGRHIHPEVIMRESENVAMLHPDVSKHLQSLRKGEIQTMGPLGFEYGKAPAPGVRKGITKAFERGEM